MEAITSQRSIAAPSGSRGALIGVLGAVAAGAIALGSLLAGVGVLYLIRTAGPLGVGPAVPGALPLQQLAGGETQPLVRLMIAWVPAGLVAGLALASLTRLGLIARTATLAAMSLAILLLAGGAADAIAITDPLGPHLAPQLTRVGTWVAVALFALGSLLAGSIQGSKQPQVV